MRNALLMFVLAIGVAALLYTWLNSSTASNSVGYGQFLTDVTADKVKGVVQEADVLTVTTKDGKTYTVSIPPLPTLTNVLADMRVAAESDGGTFDPKIYEAKPTPDNSWVGLLLTAVLPLLVIGGFIYFMMRQAQGTNNQAMSFG
jgi:cell division protease FtsH